MLNRIEISGEHSFNVGDLGVALIRSQNTVAAAVVRVIVLEKNKVRVGQVDIEDVGCTESQVSVTAQPLLLRDISVVGTRGVESARKWIWTGDYAKFDPIKGPASTVESGTRKALTVKIPGSLLHPLDAEIESIDLLSRSEWDAMHAKEYTYTWAIENDDLKSVVSAMYEGLEPTELLKLLPKHGRSDGFPYTDSDACYQCQLPIKPDESRSHVGVHILRAMRNLPESKLVEKAKHPRYWDDLEGAPCSLQKDFADSIAISSEELIALGILMGSSTAPSAKSLASQPYRSCGTKRVLDDITNTEGVPSKRQK
ncbi:hypothetical protein B0H10DRAFT_2286888 [Mycena sp. CBHHK59/15]|nr:hypothetical protein B0H10DRAFT_2286888 [Mycena sp. CBHHK59/15]